MIKSILTFLNSRTVAFWLLFLMAVSLVISTFLPSPAGMSGDEWLRFAEEGGLRYRLAVRFATPFFVTSPPFVILSLLLFLSTLVCTWNRVALWFRTKESEFTTEKAFSFSVERQSDAEPGVLYGSVHAHLSRRGWTVLPSEGRSEIIFQRGGQWGFWGSIAFHGGLLFCFVAPLVTALTGFSGELILTEGETLSLRDGVTPSPGKDRKRIPDIPVRVQNLRGVYAEGKYKLDFGGDIIVAEGAKEKRLPFSVNGAATYDGIQFSLQHFGFAPKVIVRREGDVVFDYFANLRHADEGDWFPISEELDTRMFLLFLPNFVKEQGRIRTLDQNPLNPRLAIKIVRKGSEIGRVIIAPGETARIADYELSFPELTRYSGLSVTRESGLTIIVAGFVLIIAGLAARFFSNERRLSVEVSTGAERGVLLRLRGYSRYYPAFLEREVRQIADILAGQVPP